jgi:hypothetical protein
MSFTCPKTLVEPILRRRIKRYQCAECKKISFRNISSGLLIVLSLQTDKTNNNYNNLIKRRHLICAEFPENLGDKRFNASVQIKISQPRQRTGEISPIISIDFIPSFKPLLFDAEYANIKITSESINKSDANLR